LLAPVMSVTVMSSSPLLQGRIPQLADSN
jgi:hypothetical protein